MKSRTMREVICVFLLLSSFMYCSQPKQVENTVYVNFDRPEKASLSDYFHTVELIPLETNADVLMQYVARMVCHQNRFYILDKTQSIIFVFDEKGNFIYKIDNKGQGPGQYIFIQDIYFNPFSGHLELLTPMGIIYDYDLSGNYLETRKVVYDDFHAVHHLIAIDSATRVFYSMFEPKKIIYYNLVEEKLLHDEFEEDSDIGSYAWDNFFQSKDSWYFFRPFHTVVYKIGEKKLEPAYRFDFGKFKREGLTVNFPQEPARGVQAGRDRAFTQYPYWIQMIGHNVNYIFMQLLWQKDENYVNIVYDKSTGTGKFIPKFEEDVLFVPNIVTDEYVLSWFMWIDLEKYIPQSLLDDSSKKIYKLLLESEMETNPVLIKYYFK